LGDRLPAASGIGSVATNLVRIDASTEALTDVLFVDGANGTASTMYRVSHVTSAMRRLGWSVDVIRGDRLEPLAGQEINAKVVVFFRSPLWYPYLDFAEKMRKQGATIVVDTDDFVFDETVMPTHGRRPVSQQRGCGAVPERHWRLS